LNKSFNGGKLMETNYKNNQATISFISTDYPLVNSAYPLITIFYTKYEKSD